MEAFEHRLQFILRDADALIDHIDAKDSLAEMHHKPHWTVGWRILVGVFDQIQQHLTQPGGIGLGDGIAFVGIGR